MRMLQVIVVMATLIGLITISAFAQNATSTYKYSGHSFQVSPPPVWTGVVTISLSLTTPLQSNATQVLVSPSALTISNGRTTLSSSDPQSRFVAVLWTDASANVVSWNIAGVNDTGLSIASCFAPYECNHDSTDQTSVSGGTVFTGTSPTPGTWTVTIPPTPVTASSSSLLFNAVQGGTSPAQSLVVGSSTPGVAIKTSTSLPSWLTFHNWLSGTTPATIPVAINSNGLLPGSYSCPVTFSTVNNGSVTVNVTLVVTSPGLKVNTTQLQFQYLTGSILPTPQTIQITSTGTQLPASVSLTVPWLTANTLSGSSPLNVIVGVNPAGMAVGTYNGQVVIASGSSPTQTVNVSLTITADLRPIITSAVNGASFKSGIGPGTWISIIGINFTNTTTGVSAPFLTSLHGVSAQLSGVGGAYSLLMYYISPTQINAFVPLEVAQSLFGNSCSVAVTTSNGTTSLTTQCQSLAPALFNYGTQHYASATHIDGTIVGVIPGTLPAQSGSIITLWGTGFGQTTPPTSTTSVNYSGTGGVLASPVVVLVNNTPSTLLYAGMVGVGLYQFNIQLPDGLATGDYPVTVQINGLTTDQVMLPVR